MPQTTNHDSTAMSANAASHADAAPAPAATSPGVEAQDVADAVARPANGPSGAAAAPKTDGPATRWWLAVGVGLIVSAPLVWLLSYGASLPFYLGLFFFALFGLVIGACMHRVAAAGRPYGRLTLVTGTTIVVAFGWGASIIKEARDFPMDMGSDAADRTRDIGDRTRDGYIAHVADQVRDFLRRDFPPGGTMGYIRFVLTDGVLEKGRLADVNRNLKVGQRGWIWAIRVVLSIALFAFGIGSQTLPLKLATEPGRTVKTE